MTGGTYTGDAQTTDLLLTGKGEPESFGVVIHMINTRELEIQKILTPPPPRMPDGYLGPFATCPSQVLKVIARFDCPKILDLAQYTCCEKNL